MNKMSKLYSMKTSHAIAIGGLLMSILAIYQGLSYWITMSAMMGSIFTGILLCVFAVMMCIASMCCTAMILSMISWIVVRITGVKSKVDRHMTLWSLLLVPMLVFNGLVGYATNESDSMLFILGILELVGFCILIRKLIIQNG